MKKTLKLHLRRGERLYLNGAVIEVDRKVSVSLLNDASFLLGQHVMQPEQASTALRRLYLLIQSMIISPEDGDKLDSTASALIEQSIVAYSNELITAELGRVLDLVERKRHYEAMKVLSVLFPVEDALCSLDSAVAKSKIMEPA